MFKQRLYSILVLSLVSTAHAFGTEKLSTPDSVGNKTTSNIPKWCLSDKKMGWSFYCDREKIKPKKEKEPKIQGSATPQSYTEQAKKEAQALEEARSKAVLYPTATNIVAYMTLQQKTLEKASTFAKGTQKALITNPELDYTLRRPQGQLAKEVWYDNRNEYIEKVLETVSKDYGIFFFYKSDCQYSKKYAPIIKAYSNKHRINTVAISVDGGAIAYWPKFVVNKGQRELWSIDPTVPATVLYNNKTKTVVPIGYGVLTQDEISNRILTILDEEVANDW